MICKNIQVDESNPNVYISTYLLENSNQYDKNKCRPAVLIFPGGGYTKISDREAEFVALAFAAEGYHAFVLRYSVKEHAAMPRPIVEAFQAIKLIRGHSKEWFIDPDKLVVCGFSAGGHLASCTLTMWNDPELLSMVGSDRRTIRPNAGILSYPCIVFPFRQGPVKTDYKEDSLDDFIKKAIPELGLKSAEEAQELIYTQDGYIWMEFSKTLNRMLMGKMDFTLNDIVKYSTNLRVDTGTPPTFIWTTRTDQTVPVEDSIDFVDAMIKNCCSIEFHMFGDGQHGLSLAVEQTAGGVDMISPQAAKWFSMALDWLSGVLDTRTGL